MSESRNYKNKSNLVLSLFIYLIIAGLVFFGFYNINKWVNPSRENNYEIIDFDEFSDEQLEETENKNRIVNKDLENISETNGSTTNNSEIKNQDLENKNPLMTKNYILQMDYYLDSLKNCSPGNFQIDNEMPFLFDATMTANSGQLYSIIGSTEEGCQVHITQTKMYFSKTSEEDYKKVLIYFNSYDESEYNYPSDEEINEKLKKINDSYSYLLDAESTCYFNEEQIAMFVSDFEQTKEGIIEMDTTKDSFLYSNCEGDLFN